MRPLIIDLPRDTSDLLRPADSPALKGVVEEIVDPKSPMRDGAGFENKL